MRKTFLRIGRHPATPDQEKAIRAIFGEDIEIVREDVGYGEEPVAVVRSLIERLEASGKVVAVEITAPFPVLMKLVSARREIGVPLLRKEVKREMTADGSLRGIVVGKDEDGRDILAFSHYEELLRVEFETRRYPQS